MSLHKYSRFQYVKLVNFLAASRTAGPDNMHQQPDFVAAVRNDLSDWRQWLGRGVVLAYAAAAGLAVVAFTWLSEHALHGFAVLRDWQPLLPLLWTPASTAALAWITLRFVPGAARSGLPPGIAALSAQ